MVTVQELRDTLVGSGKYSRQQIAGVKGKSNLQFLVNQLKDKKVHNPKKFSDSKMISTIDYNPFETIQPNDSEVVEDNLFDDIEELSQNQEKPEDVTVLPPYGSDDWHDFIMAAFTPSEIEGGNPKVVGLRRVAEDVLGEIIFSGPISVEVHRYNENIPVFVCIYEIRFIWNLGVEPYVDITKDLPMRVYRAAADAHIGSVVEPYSLHLTAMAETRAEGRVLRKALKLKQGVVAAEELSSKDGEAVNQLASSWTADDKIQSAQSNFIHIKCKQLGVDVLKFITYGQVEGENKYGSLEEVSRNDAIKMITTLSEFQNNSREMPEEILV